jgi:hypothetical protein
VAQPGDRMAREARRRSYQPRSANAPEPFRTGSLLSAPLPQRAGGSRMQLRFAKFFVSWSRLRYELSQWFRISEATFVSFIKSQDFKP